MPRPKRSRPCPPFSPRCRRRSWSEHGRNSSNAGFAGRLAKAFPTGLTAEQYATALQAARELVSPIISMTITLAAVYTPLGIQGGLTGSLFREFAFTLAGAVIVSGIVALTLGAYGAVLDTELRRAFRS